jgi:hypothetical protein
MRNIRELKWFKIRSLAEPVSAHFAFRRNSPIWENE